MIYRNLLAGAALAAALGAPLTASAQMYPERYAQTAHHISGRVASFGGYDLQLENGRRVALHRGTVIDPTGWTIRPGQRVAVEGSWIRGVFQADRIVIERRR